MDTACLELDELIFDDDLDVFKSNINFELISSPLLRFVGFIDGFLEVELLEDCDDFYQLVNDIDRKVINEILKKSRDFWGSDINIMILNNLFKKSFSLPEYVPAMPKMQFVIEDQFSRVFDENNQKIPVLDLEAGTNIKFNFSPQYVLFHQYYCKVCFVIVDKTNGFVNDDLD